MIADLDAQLLAAGDLGGKAGEFAAERLRGMTARGLPRRCCGGSRRTTTICSSLRTQPWQFRMA